MLKMPMYFAEMFKIQLLFCSRLNQEMDTEVEDFYQLLIRFIHCTLSIHVAYFNQPENNNHIFPCIYSSAFDRSEANTCCLSTIFLHLMVLDITNQRWRIILPNAKNKTFWNLSKHTILCKNEMKVIFLFLVNIVLVSF